MLDAAFIRDNLDAVKANCARRNVKPDVDVVVALDDRRKHVVQERQVIQQRQNEVAKATGKEKDPAKRQELVAEGKALKEKVAGLEQQEKQVDADLLAALKHIPNMTNPAAPVGGENDYKVVNQWARRGSSTSSRSIMSCCVRSWTSPTLRRGPRSPGRSSTS